MRVPEYQRQYAREDVNKGGARLRVPDGGGIGAEAFGARAGWELERAGRSLMHAATQTGYVIDDYNSSVARDAAGKMRQNFLAWQAEAEKRKGKDGMNAAADYDKWEQGQMRELAQSMNDVQRGRFMSAAEMQGARFRSWAEGYGNQEGRNYTIASHEGRMSSNNDMLMRNIHDPALASQAIEQLKADAIGLSELHGQDGDAMKANVSRAVTGGIAPAISARIQAGETGLAAGLIKHYGGMIDGAAQMQLRARLKSRWEHQAAEARVARAVQEMDYMFQQFGGDLGAGYAYIREKYAHDPKARLELEGAFSRRVGMEEAAENRKRKMELDAQKTSGLDAINAQDATPASISKILMTASPENLPELTRAARMRFPDADAIVASDREKLSEAKAEALEGIRDWDGFRRKYQPWITGAEMEKFEAKFKQQQDRASDSSPRSSFNTMMREYNIEALANAVNMTPAEYQNSVWDRFVDESFARNFTTARERRDFMGEFLRRVSLSKPGYFWGNAWPSAKEVPEFESAPLRAEGYIEVPGDARRAIAAQLEAAGREATEGNILKVWQYNQTRNKAAKQ